MPVSGDTRCPFLSPVAEDFGPVRAQNVSADGIGLLVGRRVDPGALLAVTLANAAHGFARTVLVRVSQVAAQPGGSYLVGGTFTTPLTYEELRALVM
jgi:hypothetical protein